MMLEKLKTRFKFALLSPSKLLTLEKEFGQLSNEDYSSYLTSLRYSNLDFLHLLLFDELNFSVPSNLMLEFKREKIINEHLKKIAIRLGENGALENVVCFKGFLNDELVGHKYYKRRSDIDILIYSDFENSVKKISALLNCELLKMQNYGEISLKTEQGLRIDAHYNLLSSTPFVFKYNLLKNLNSNTYRRNIGNTEINVFNLEFTIIYQIIHFAIQHSFSEFILLFEIAELIKNHHEKIDIDYFIGLIETHKVELPVCLVFQILEDKVEHSFFKNERINGIIRSNEQKLISAKTKIEKNLFTVEIEINLNLNRILSENLRNVALNYLRTIYLYSLRLTYIFRRRSIRRLVHKNDRS
ncbi:MAG: nucleotidyltransferase family protein [Bacteroidota bacterium]